MTTTDLFLKTWTGDLAWVDYLVRSIDRYCTGFRKLVVVSDSDQFRRPEKMLCEWVKRDEERKPYLSQQAHKLYADIYTDADYLLHVDSDCVFVRPVTPNDFFQDHRPIWLMTEWANVDADCRRAWFDVVAKFMGEPSTHEGMRRHPQLLPRWFYQSLRGFCIGKHGQTLWNYVMEQPNRDFTEFNCAFAYAKKWHEDRFTFLDTHKDPFPPDYMRQFWSYGGITPEIKAIIEQILA